jgi:hypothetical protein
MDIQNALISSGITSSIYILYKTIQHYRIHSSCNQNNQLIIEVVDIEKPDVKPDDKPNDKTEEKSIK